MAHQYTYQRLDLKTTFDLVKSVSKAFADKCSHVTYNARLAISCIIANGQQHLSILSDLCKTSMYVVGQSPCTAVIAFERADFDAELVDFMHNGAMSTETKTAEPSMVLSVYLYTMKGRRPEFEVKPIYSVDITMLVQGTNDPSARDAKKRLNSVMPGRPSNDEMDRSYVPRREDDLEWWLDTQTVEVQAAHAREEEAKKQDFQRMCDVIDDTLEKMNPPRQTAQWALEHFAENEFNHQVLIAKYTAKHKRAPDPDRIEFFKDEEKAALARIHARIAYDNAKAKEATEKKRDDDTMEDVQKKAKTKTKRIKKRKPDNFNRHDEILDVVNDLRKIGTSPVSISVIRKRVSGDKLRLSSLRRSLQRMGIRIEKIVVKAKKNGKDRKDTLVYIL